MASDYLRSRHDTTPVSRLTNRRLAWGVLLLCLALTVVVWRQALQETRQAEKDAFNIQAEQVEASLRARLEGYQNVVRSATALVSLQEKDLSPERWASFVERLVLPKTYPAIQGLGVLGPVTHEGSTGLMFSPGAVLSNQSLGRSFFQQASIQLTLEKAHQQHQPAFSSKLTWARDKDAVQTGFVVASPLNQVANDPRAVVALVEINTLVDYLHKRYPHVQVGIWVGENPQTAERLYPRILPTMSRQALHRNFTLNMPQQTWQVWVWSVDGSANGSERPFLVAMVGSLLSVLAFGLVWHLATTRERAWRVAWHMTEKIRDNEQRYREMFTNNCSVKLVVDPSNGAIIDANPAAADFYGYPLDVLKTLRISDINTQPMTQVQDLMRAVEQQHRWHFTTTHRVANGEVREVEVYSGPITFAGKPALYSIIHDITERERAQVARQQSEQRLQDITSALAEGVYVIDKEGKILFVNPEAERLLGWPAAEMIGNAACDLFHRREHSTACPVKQVLHHGHALQSEDEIFVRHDGQQFAVSLSCAPLREGANIRGVVVAFRDISEQKRIQDQVRSLALYNRNLFESSLDPLFTVDFDGTITDVNIAAEQATGLPRFELIGSSFARYFVEPVMAKQQLNFAQENTIRDVNLSLRHLSGAVMSVLLNATCYQHPENGNFGLFVTLRDITERKKAEERLRLIYILFENTTEAVIITDAKGNILQVNPAFTVLNGYAEEEVVGKTPKILRSGLQDIEFYKNLRQQLLQQGSWRGEIWNRHKNGQLLAGILSINAIYNEQQQVTHYISVFADITELKASQAKLEQMAHYDHLTDLPNRTLFYQVLQEALAAAALTQTSVAVMFLDLDGFKAVNDTWGHDIGDLLLQTVAQRLRRLLRQGDMASRLGGDEFTALLRDIDDVAQLQSIAARVIDSINAPLVLRGCTVQVGVSIGIALFPQDAPDFLSLIKAADTAMYAAKQGGKNRYCFAATLPQAATVTDVGGAA